MTEEPLQICERVPNPKPRGRKRVRPEKKRSKGDSQLCRGGKKTCFGKKEGHFVRFWKGTKPFGGNRGDLKKMC